MKLNYFWEKIFQNIPINYIFIYLTDILTDIMNKNNNEIDNFF